MDRTIAALLILPALLAGCYTENFDGPRGCRMEPAVDAGTDSSFDNDYLSVTIETFAQDERDEPQIESVKVYANDREVDADVKLERIRGSAGYSQKASFFVPTDARTIKAVLIVQHEDGLWEISVPFDRGSGKAKWHRQAAATRYIGVADNRPKPSPTEQPIHY